MDKIIIKYSIDILNNKIGRRRGIVIAAMRTGMRLDETEKRIKNCMGLIEGMKNAGIPLGK